MRIQPLRSLLATGIVGALLLPAPGVLGSQRDDAILALNAAMDAGAATFPFEPINGYLRSVLEHLSVPVESQILVYSPASFQSKLINQENPRAIYFNDNVAVAWVRGSSSIEAAAADPDQGTLFYTLEQTAAGSQRFRRDDSCLACHQSQRTLSVPGVFVLSAHRDGHDRVSDHRTPLTERWGGWFVTGVSSRFRHLGNRTGQGWLHSLYDQFDLSGYVTDYSDMVALMTFEHQTQAGNLITQLRWAARTDEPGPRLKQAVNALVDYLLFIEEAPLPSRIIGTSGFSEKFASIGPFDRRGRSLRQFDLHRRMMMYPCSYMIYSNAFDALPRAVKDSVYAPMSEILAGRINEASYARISDAEREAIIEIIQDTKRDLPPFFRSPSFRVSSANPTY